MHKDPKEVKEFLTHEGQESDEMERKEHEDPEHGKEMQKKMGKGAHLQHPQLKGEKAHELMNDMAYHLHHPQFNMKGPKLPFNKSPKGK